MGRKFIRPQTSLQAYKTKKNQFDIAKGMHIMISNLHVKIVQLWFLNRSLSLLTYPNYINSIAYHF